MKNTIIKTNAYARTSQGKNDECYTPRYGVEVLLEFLPRFKNKIIWCPFDTEESEFVKVFKEHGYNVVYSHIWNGQDFFTYEPEKWDLMISNPPFTNKAEIFKRALKFNKPFALLNSVLWLNDTTPTYLFANKKLELLLLTKRIEYKNQTVNGKINFKSIYYCHDFLPNQIEIRDFNYGQRKLLEV